LADMSLCSMWGASRKALALALAGVMLAVTMVAVPMPGWVPLVGDNSESASADHGYYQWVPGHHRKSPVTRYRQTCVEWQIDYQTDQYVCGRYQTTSYVSYEYYWIPGYNKWVSLPHPLSFCSRSVQTSWGLANFGMTATPEPITTAVGGVSSLTQVVTAAVFCY